jgi:DNA-directed RNA polymerase specialized sigma24 family protein
VPGPGKDESIKSLLLSSDALDRRKGFVELDEGYRRCVSGYVRSWSNRHAVRISPEDLADIWSETLTCVIDSVEGGRFHFDGDLGAYLRTIARRRAIDLLRRRITDYERAVQAFASGRFTCPSCDLLEEIRACVEELPETLGIVLQCDVQLFYREYDWVSQDELTKEVNQCHGLGLTKDAVVSRRRRGRERLQTLQHERGIK